MKELNTADVRKALQAAGSATVRELAETTGLSSVTTGSIVQKLVNSHMARPGGLLPSLGGRRSRQYEFVADYVLVATVLTREIEGRDTALLRVADLNGTVIDAVDSPFIPDSLTSLETLLDPLFARYPKLAALGFGVPGIALDGTIIVLDYPALLGARFEEHFQSRYGVPVVVENDVNAAVLGRGRRAGSAATEAYVYFPRKYGPGAGLRMGDQLIKGRRNFAGEISWLPLGISWGAAQTSFGDAAEAVARVVVSLTAVLAPESVVLFGEFLTPGHCAAIEARCRALLPDGMTPVLTLADDFTQDLQEGLVGLTLDLLRF